MGKIKTVTIGSEEETVLKEKARLKREQKKLRKHAETKEATPTTEFPKGAPHSAAELPAAEVEPILQKQKPTEVASTEKKRTKNPKIHKATRSQRYQDIKKMINQEQKYTLIEAIKLLKSFPEPKFDETVELHFNLTDKGIKTTLTLPHSMGKKFRVAILAENREKPTPEELFKKIDAGKIDFDILITTPEMMPRLAKYAKVLGPRGLMPNPKAGTITDDPDKAAKNFTAGQTTFKSDPEIPVLHAAIGKLSFTEKQLEENAAILIHALSGKIKSSFLKSTMSPAIKLA